MGKRLFTQGNLFILSILLYTSFHLITGHLSKDVVFRKAEIQSCSGCSLNRLSEVKAFIFEDVPKYDDVTFKHIQGAMPELVLYSEEFKEVERIPLKGHSREQCNTLLKDKGFKKKTEKQEKEL